MQRTSSTQVMPVTAHFLIAMSRADAYVEAVQIHHASFFVDSATTTDVSAAIDCATDASLAADGASAMPAATSKEKR